MIHISGHLRPIRREIGFEDTGHALAVNCCGFEKYLTKNAEKNRPKGRLDYQLIYIFKGHGHFLLEGAMKELSAGSLVLYPPGVPQHYTYFANEKPEIFWVHFTGSRAGELLTSYGLAKSCGFIGEQPSVCRIFEDMIHELQLKKPYFEDITCSLLRELLARTGRLAAGSVPANPAADGIDRLILHLNRHYTENWSVDSMAGFCGLSPGYFAHSFKETAGLAPMHYLNQIRMENAKELLADEALSITAVASLTGFPDPYYFSRVFRRLEGCSPSEYRRELKT